MTKITDHFSLEEFACHDEEKTPYPKEWIEDRLTPLCQALEVIRGLFNKPVSILSGYRTPLHNTKVGGAKNSEHVQGRAADIRIQGVGVEQLSEKIGQLIQEERIPEGGLGIYPHTGFVHYDIRGLRRRWRGR